MLGSRGYGLGGIGGEERGCGRTSEDVAVFVLDVAYDEGREECQEEIPEPVGGGRECALLGARACWEGLAD